MACHALLDAIDGPEMDYTNAAELITKPNFPFIFLVNLTAFIFGIVIGFTGPNLELFKSDDSPLATGKITKDEESWISSLSAFGAIGFTLIYGWISEKFGRKKAILLIGIPQTVVKLVDLRRSACNFSF